MTRLRALSLGLAFLLGAPAASADLSAPGLSLDRDDLRDLDIQCPNITACGSDLRNLQLGAPANVKGAKDPGTTESSLLGRFKGVVAPGNIFPSAIGRPAYVGYYGGPGTLIPPLASGFVRHITDVPSVYIGNFVQALLYEPDQIKRKETRKESRALLKQKSHVAFRWGQTSAGRATSSPDFAFVEKCKAQAEIRQRKSDDSKTYKFKLRCSGNDKSVSEIKDQLELLFGKRRSGFDLENTVAAP